MDFFQGDDFADFRKEEDVKQGRDPFYVDPEEESVHPWMTSQSMLGNHHSVVIYNARQHCIGIIDQESCGRTGHNLHKVPAFAMQDISEDKKEHVRKRKRKRKIGKRVNDSTMMWIAGRPAISCKRLSSGNTNLSRPREVVGTLGEIRMLRSSNPCTANIAGPM